MQIVLEPAGLGYGAVANYVQNTHHHINRWLRGQAKGMSSATKKTVAGLTSDMDEEFADPKAPRLKERMTVHRGIPSAALYAAWSRKGKALVGTVVTDKGFTSTSRSESYALDWAMQHDEPAVLMHLDMPKGTVFLRPGRTDEKEYIFNRGLRLKVTKVKNDPLAQSRSGIGPVLHVWAKLVT